MNSCCRSAQLGIFFALFLGIQLTSHAQCFNSGTTPYLYTELSRSGGNSMYTLAETYVEGPYRYNWLCEVVMTETQDGFTFRNRSNVGNTAIERAYVEYSDTLSNNDVGPGTYSFNSSHRATCGINISTGTSTESLVVYRPTIQDPGVNGVWWLGSFGAHDAANGYYPTAGFNASKNCNPGDTCPEAGNWTVAGDMSANTYTGTSIQLTGNAPSRDPNEVVIQFDIGGFAAELAYFTVNTPYRLVLNASTDAAYDNDDNEPGVGWETITNYSIIDRFGNVLAPIAYNEACEECIDYGVIDVNSDTVWIPNNWPWKPVATKPISDPGGRISDIKRFLDTYVSSPNPAYVFPLDEPAASTLVDSREQTWRIGNATAGIGSRVQKNRLNRYRGRARAVNIVTPSDPY